MPNASISRRLRLVIAALCAALLPLALAPATSAVASTQARTWQVAVGEESANQAIQGMAFLPGTVWIDVGDSIAWTARAAEIHTVTFLAAGQTLPEFNPFDPAMVLPQGGTSYDGVSYYNSGLMSNVTVPGFPTGQHYSLTFAKAGNYTYYCLVHGVMMKGTVHVRAAGTPYPYSQLQYNIRSTVERARIIADGYRLWGATLAQATSNHVVFAGADDGVAMVMRFIRHTVHVRVGSSVTFRNIGMAAPHTVTFGPEQANIFVPYGDPAHFTGGQLNSGLLLPGSSFTVTFDKAGTYHYICGLHDYMGMLGTVVVGG